MALMKVEMQKQYHKHLILFIAVCILYPLISAAIIALFYRYTRFSIVPVVFVPFFVRWAVVEIQTLQSERECLKILTTNKTDYAEYMTLIFEKAELTENDRKKAEELFASYRDTYLKQHDELVGLLRSEIKRRPPDRLSIGVLAGLIIMSGNREDYELLFKTKYRYSSVGTFVPDIWIRALDKNFPELYEKHSELSNDFITWWDTETGHSAN